MKFTSEQMGVLDRAIGHWVSMGELSQVFKKTLTSFLIGSQADSYSILERPRGGIY